QFETSAERAKVRVAPLVGHPSEGPDVWAEAPGARGASSKRKTRAIDFGTMMRTLPMRHTYAVYRMPACYARYRCVSRLSTTITMKDIARSLGVSQSTVSRVLSGTPSALPIATTTRERILAEARRLGYRPNPLASGLRGARTRLLGVIMGEIIGPWGVSAID